MKNYLATISVRPKHRGHGGCLNTQTLGGFVGVVIRVAVVVTTALVLLLHAFGISSAGTDPLVGKTYEDASSVIAEWGSTPVISTVFGGTLATDACKVTSWQKVKRQIDGSRRSAVLVNLFCDNGIATGAPGNSAASPQGKAAKIDMKTAEWCSRPEQAGRAKCATFCSKHDGLCTANF